MSLETEDLLEYQASIARICGAIAHELNSPLQGVLSILAVCGSESVGRDHERLEKIRAGLLRMTRFVESLSTIYENLPREAERISVGNFLDLLTATLTERNIRADTSVSMSRDMSFHALVAETVRLIAEVFSMPSPMDGSVNIRMNVCDGRAELVCERDSTEPAEPWSGLADQQVCSGLAVLMDELTKLAGGKSEFKFDHASLSGIRLCFRTRMN